MQGKEFKNIKISGLACAVPNYYVKSDTYVDFYGEAVVERFKKATGIEGRYISKGKNIKLK